MTVNPEYASYVTQVLAAKRQRQPFLSESVAALSKGLSYSDSPSYLHTFAPWADELAAVNAHITVRPEEVKEAEAAYLEVANHLMRELDWTKEDIKILVQGSASTQTLIRSPMGNEKFDIDAVCQVDISRIEARYPMQFFDAVGDALAPFDPSPKKRCWKINFNNATFYIEFTPSVPWATVSAHFAEAVSPYVRNYSPVERYGATALAVVDTPSQGWKPSNPAGMSKWVNDIAGLRLLREALFSEAVMTKAEIEQVPDQDVDMEDTLRVAIRLFKRHRDMCVRRGEINKETQPISIILVTLLTKCYAGLHELGHVYHHPLELLVDLAELLPGMIVFQDNEYWVANPTVEGENFAEKWNTDEGARANTFKTWCDRLAADLRTILAMQTPEEIREQVSKVFGTPASSGPNTGVYTGVGLGGTPAKRRPPSPPPRTSGLA